MKVETQSFPSILTTTNMVALPAGSVRNEYMVKMVFGKTTGKETTLHYRTRVSLEQLSDGYLARIEKKDYLINYQIPTLLIEVLAEDCRQAIKKIEFKLDGLGTIEQLLNYEEILQSWEQKKVEILSKFSGEIAEKYIKMQDDMVKNQDVLLHKLKQDFFLNQYFCKIYNRAFNTGKLNVVEHSNILNFKYKLPIQYKIENQQKNEEQFEFLKTIDSTYKQHEMPIQNFQSKYIFDKNQTLHSIECAFEAMGQKMDFSAKHVHDMKAFD